MSKQHIGSSAFNDFFKSIYQDRWNDLYEAMKKDKSYLCLNNPFVEDHLEFDKDFIQILDQKFYLSFEFPAPTKDDRTNLSNYYLMDPASYIVAKVLNPRPGDKVLDMCAAPGGKSLGLYFLNKGDIKLHLIEKSKGRFERLKRNIESYLPKDELKNIEFFHKDAAKWGLYHADQYDKILLDAPCSHERHLLHDQKYLEQWSEKKSKRVSKDQFTLLAAAYDSLKPNGTLVYSTCSISPYENEEVVSKLRKKRGDRVCYNKIDLDYITPLDYGYEIFPDKTGLGPIYFCSISKKEN